MALHPLGQGSKLQRVCSMMIACRRLCKTAIGRLLILTGACGRGAERWLESGMLLVLPHNNARLCHISIRLRCMWQQHVLRRRRHRRMRRPGGSGDGKQEVRCKRAEDGFAASN